MRGSPLLRTMITALCLGLAALVLRWVTGDDEPVLVGGAVAPEVVGAGEAAVADVPFAISLSAAASRLVVADETGAVLWQGEGPELSLVQGNLPRLPESLVLRVTWADAGAPRYFAKMVIDPPGRRSLTHVFDAVGEIDDLWELP